MNTLYLKNVDVNIESGELIGIIGPNGSGKTLLLKIISGRVKNDCIYIDKKRISEFSTDFKKNNIVCVFDDNIYNTRTPIDELKYYLDILNIKEKEINIRIDNFINYFSLEEIIDKDFIELDIQNRIYIKILSLLIICPYVFCIDDLLTFLTKDMKMKIINYIKDNNIILLAITSNMEELILFDKILVMNKGKKELYDDTRNILKREDVFNELGLNLPFIYDINNMLKNYDLIEKDYLVYKELVNLLWK